MKLIVELKGLTQISFLKRNQLVSHLIVGIKNLSLTPANVFSIDDITNIIQRIKNTHLKLILNAERLFSDFELETAKKVIEQLPLDFFDYIMYSDFGLYQLLCEMNLRSKCILRAPTYLTNGCDVNLYNDLNKYVVLSSEISSYELIDLSKQCKRNVIVDLFGQTQCFYSRRKLLTNYFLYRHADQSPNKKKYLIQEELRNELQPIIEDETGTHIFETQKHYLLDELKKLENIEYGIIHTNFLTNEQIKIVIDAYTNYLRSLDTDQFIKLVTKANIKFYKGAYDIKSVLLKGASSYE